MWTNLLLIFLGGGLGSVLRFLVSHYFSRFEMSIPLGTLVVNVLGSLLLGLFVGLAHKNNWAGSQLSILFTIGFCGGFTTFSTFAYENVLLLKQGDWLMSILYAVVSLGLGLLVALLGIQLTR